MKGISRLMRIMNVAFFIARKSVQRGSRAVKIVTVFILMLTFLNLTVVGGLLNGITEDIGIKVRDAFVGDVFVKPIEGYSYIQNTNDFFPYLRENPLVAGYSPRLLSGVNIESDYKRISGSRQPTHVGTTLTGIDPIAESSATILPKKIIAGRFLNENETGSIVLGASLVDGYIASRSGSSDTLGHVLIGDKVRVRLPSGSLHEFTVVGITHTKASSMDQRAFVNYKELRSLLELSDNKYSEIAIRATDSAVATSLEKYLKEKNEAMGFKNDVKGLSESVPSAVDDVKKAFALIGSIVSVIAILVGLITIFVIIFVNASSRRRYLGILKAQGIESSALILSYVLQALLYTVIGVIIGTAILYIFLQGYFEKNPLSLPMADGSLLLGFDYVSARVIMLLISSLISGFIPAWFIIRQNTLDSILGR